VTVTAARRFRVKRVTLTAHPHHSVARSVDGIFGRLGFLARPLVASGTTGIAAERDIDHNGAGNWIVRARKKRASRTKDGEARADIPEAWQKCVR
jgi:hypothetical protein